MYLTPSICAAVFAAGFLESSHPVPRPNYPFFLPSVGIHPLETTEVRIELDESCSKANLLDIPARSVEQLFEDPLGVAYQNLLGQIVCSFFLSYIQVQ